MLQLIESDYFMVQRNALELFIKLKDNKELVFSVADLQKSLAVLMNKKGRYWFAKMGLPGIITDIIWKL